ncbi:MAG TPA: sensor histidine kinase [Acidothermaceae bacterium]|nr:sensor histidine kinase [Acidothermaceae bacterium]
MAFPSPHRRSPRLSTQVLLLQIVIILLTVGAGFAVSYERGRHELDVRAGQQSLAIANTVASTPAVVNAFALPDPATVIQPIAESVRRATGAAFIVVANDEGIRYSHPNPAMVGTSLLHDPGEDPAGVLAGHTFVGVQPGSLGRSVRAKVPLRDHNGKVIGLVSVGVLETKLSSELRANVPATLIPPLLGLALGTIGAFLLARRVKRQTFGLEPEEIATLLEQREAMLHGVREGAITVDVAGRLSLVNDEATRLLGIDQAAIGKKLADLLPAGRVRDVLTGQTDGRDEMILVGDRVLVVNRVPVEVRGRPVGAVVTLRDRTELDALLRELDDVRSLADALRAQEHEFANRLHVIGGLIELERYDEAVQFIHFNSLLHQELAASLVERIGDPILSGLLLGKASVASERGLNLRIAAITELPDVDDVHKLVTVVGNLIDNALDSAAQTGPGGQVDVSLAVRDEHLVVQVHDSGPGIDPELVEEIFRDGFTTKVARDGHRRRGLGLALVSQEVRRRGGTISVKNVDGALFTVVIPLHARDGALEAAIP